MHPGKLREALRNQGIHVHESDPILDMAAICDAVMADTLKAIDGMMKAAADRASAAAAQTVEASKRTAESIVSQGSAFVVEQCREAIREATAAMLMDLHREVAKAERASHIAGRIAWGSVCIGAIILAGAAGFLLAGLLHH